MYAECDGADVTVWRGESGGAMAQVLSTSSAEFLTSASLYFSMTGTNKYRYDNIKVLSDDLSESVTYAHNDANELTSMSDVNGTTSFTYDDWGRTATKSRSSLSATYAYRYGHKLYDVDSNFPDEGDVTYETGGDGKRRSRVAGADETWYNWAGWTVVNEEDDAVGDGNLTRTYVGRTSAHVDGTNPATGAYTYYTQDHLGSVRALYDQSKNLQGSREYSPYGSILTASNLNLTTHGFTGHDWDTKTGMYFAPFRYYSPGIGRWTTRDPLGFADGPNIYNYAVGDPVGGYDPLGLTFQGVVNDKGDITITYWMDKDPDCDEIKIVQIARTNRNLVDFWMGAHWWHLDCGQSGAEEKCPYYAWQDCSDTRVECLDSPKVDGIGGTQYFETCAVCSKGKNKGKIYGCMTWEVTSSWRGKRTFKGIGKDLPDKDPSKKFLKCTKGKL